MDIKRSQAADMIICMLEVSLDRSINLLWSQRPWTQCRLFWWREHVCFKAWLNADTLTFFLTFLTTGEDEIQQHQLVHYAFCVCTNGYTRGGKQLIEAANRKEEKETNSPHLLTFTLAALLIAFPSFRLLRGSSARTPTRADDFLANFAATSRPSSEGDREELLPSSKTSFNRGSSAALPPKKYKSRKTPKHTAITTTLQWIRMVRATCCGWKRQTVLRSCLRVRESSPSWHFVTAPSSHFSADDDGERREELLNVHRGLHRGGVASPALP